jgi:quercetin dioxygenase-like cupin family protein
LACGRAGRSRHYDHRSSITAGQLDFRWGDDTFGLSDGGFIFLPRGIEHGYRIRGEGEVRLPAVTAPAQEDASGGWGGFAADFEAQGELRRSPSGSG